MEHGRPHKVLNGFGVDDDCVSNLHVLCWTRTLISKEGWGLRCRSIDPMTANYLPVQSVDSKTSAAFVEHPATASELVVGLARHHCNRYISDSTIVGRHGVGQVMSHIALREEREDIQYIKGMRQVFNDELVRTSDVFNDELVSLDKYIVIYLERL